MKLPEILSADEIRGRLEVIFPEGTTDRGYLIRELAAKVIFTMIYSGAVEGHGIWIGPKQVYRMSNDQAALTGDRVRVDYGLEGWKSRFLHTGDAWYADNSREPIRDETLRGLTRCGAVIEKADVPTNSGKPRYALATDFVRLLDPQVTGNPLADSIKTWQRTHLAAHTLARMELVRQRRTAGADAVDVILPNRGVRQLAPGPSALITKAVIEEFAPRFLYAPAVLFLSESRKKVIDIDLATTKSIGLDIRPSRILPDIVLFDTIEGDELLIFVEVVATDGPITLERRDALRALIPYFAEDRIAFVTAYDDRGSPAFRKTVGSLAWNTLVWFASEPDYIMILRGSTALEERRVFDLLRDED